ncbi:MAG TPA: NAD(P)H-binding protein [Pilimelia sp.]|nr:NAD(P)H-binding protein [Pilimelia sp.]
MTVLVTGATGQVGRRVVAHLLAAGHRVRALTRHPAKAASLPGAVEVVAGDLTAPDTVAPALDGVTNMHLITVGGDDYATLDTGPELVRLAHAAGVRRVAVLWNGQPGPVETAVQAGGPAWTVLQPTDFMGNALSWASAIRAGRAVAEPFGDVPSAVIDEDDVGAVAAAVLTGDGHAGRTYPLTGPAALTPRQRLAVIGAAVGRPVEFVELTEEQARRRWRDAGHGAELIDLLAAWQSDPPPAAYTPAPTVERILGRPPRTLADWARDHADAFR